MNVFVAGASGVVGRALIPKLVAGAHAVTVMTRTPENRDELQRAGATAVACDVAWARPDL
ncbi:MAG: NAD(P)H-binding protein [Actinobacteria bacterium]|nr:NAD(P)H-binding protein [Actinomycetota bacterium]